MTQTMSSGERRFTVSKRQFSYDDPFADDQRDRVVSELRDLEALAASHLGAQAGHRRKRLSSIDLDNPATAELLRRLTTFGHWLSQIPTASALHVLYDPDVSTYATGVPLDDDIRSWFRNIADARGIRSRAAVMRQLLTEAALEAKGESRWLSLACGAAQPVFHTMEALAAAGVAVPHTTLADLDRDALALARSYAEGLSLEERAMTIRMNVLDRRGLGTRRSPVPGLRLRTGWTEAFNAVDAVGLLEYLQGDDWTYTYNGVITTRRKQAGARTFLTNAFNCVAPGGQLIVGNMLDSHPELGFTMDVVQWPHIQPRSVDEMLGLFASAGLRGHVDVHLPEDGVYAVYAIRKP